MNPLAKQMRPEQVQISLAGMGQDFIQLPAFFGLRHTSFISTDAYSSVPCALLEGVRPMAW
jgi:hypothetical protein